VCLSSHHRFYVCVRKRAPEVCVCVCVCRESIADKDKAKRAYTYTRTYTVRGKKIKSMQSETEPPRTEQTK